MKVFLHIVSIFRCLSQVFQIPFHVFDENPSDDIKWLQL